MRSLDIVNKSDNRSKSRANRQNINAKLYKVNGNTIEYTVTSSEGDKQYLVRIQLLNLTSNKLKSLKSALSGDIKLSCTCPAFLFQGYKYITWKAKSGIEPENRAPDIRNPNREGMTCKHILVALNQLKSDYSAIYNMMKDSIKTQSNIDNATNDKDDNSSIINNDIELITEFKSACDKLYKNYTDYLKSGIEEPFINSKYYDDKVLPNVILSNLSKQTLKLLSSRFIGKLNSFDTILSFIDSKKNGFNILVDSDTKSIIKKLNELIDNKNEAYINNIILTLIGD